MTDEQALLEKINDLCRKLDILTAITATTIFQDKQFTDKVSILMDMGLKNNEIAIILGKSPNAVRSIKSMLLKNVKKKTIKTKKLGEKNHGTTAV
jgi:DNA-binding NarL/FixJ family response regulator